ncbi:hypothetical protein SKAU_G00393390 [Synaphobranchus kaupii]|uniref:Uncharacterized protein n=1 Tax=Synaphobranchus kaupii TaxID=118154 RepID=A0A9Q1EC04_SYNKA|nr:hypothetical protein SKAU_G00393390 [Synaphobranchus kaupii]
MRCVKFRHCTGMSEVSLAVYEPGEGRDVYSERSGVTARHLRQPINASRAGAASRPMDPGQGADSQASEILPVRPRRSKPFTLLF